MPADNITIKRIVKDLYAVTCTFANGYSFVETCHSEIEARAYVRGLQHGITNVKNVIGTGPHFTGNIEDVKDRRNV